MSSRPDRVLIIGVSNPLGAEAAERLAPHVSALFGCDVADPISAIEAMDFVHADTRQSVIGKLVRQLRIDTVVHLAVTVDSAREDRGTHETNVIGTMNVLAGCAGSATSVQRLVVKSSQAVYGAGPLDPSFFSEEMAGSTRSTSTMSRDLVEMESMVQDFAVRNPHTRVCVLRLGFAISYNSTLGKYLSLPVVPTYAGFDPRLQFLHPDDAAEAVVRAVLGGHEGVYNVAADGILMVSQAIEMMGGKAAPILPYFGGSLARMVLRALTGVELPGHIADVLTYGSVADCSALLNEFGWKPARTTRAVMQEFVGGREDVIAEPPSPPQEYELQVYLQRRRGAYRAGHRGGNALAARQ